MPGGSLQVFTGWQIRRIARSVPPADADTARLALAVTIAAHNEAVGLPDTLAALLDQTDPPDEIVIADDGSTDPTIEMLCGNYSFTVLPVGQVSGPVRVGSTALRWLRLPHGGKSVTPNAGLLRTDADVILTVDADTVPDRWAIGAVRQAFSREPQLVAVTGVITPRCPPTVLGRATQWFQTYEYIRNFLGRYAWI